MYAAVMEDLFTDIAREAEVLLHDVSSHALIRHIPRTNDFAINYDYTYQLMLRLLTEATYPFENNNEALVLRKCSAHPSLCRFIIAAIRMAASEPARFGIPRRVACHRAPQWNLLLSRLITADTSHDGLIQEVASHTYNVLVDIASEAHLQLESLSDVALGRAYPLGNTIYGYTFLEEMVKDLTTLGFGEYTLGAHGDEPLLAEAHIRSLLHDCLLYGPILYKFVIACIDKMGKSPEMFARGKGQQQPLSRLNSLRDDLLRLI